MSSSYPREYWKIVKMQVKDNLRMKMSRLKNCNNTFSLSDIDKANTLNEFFSSISCVDDTYIKLPLFTFKTNSRLEDFIINKQEIKDTLLNLFTNQASGPDEISHKLLKETSESLRAPLCLLFNLSLNGGIYPDFFDKLCWRSDGTYYI
jgi:hypothetical protein